MDADANRIIKEINILLSKQRLYQKEIYEHLISNGVINPGTEKEFKKLYGWAFENEFIDRSRIRNWNKKKGKLPKYFTKKQLVRIFDVIDRPKDSITCFMALMCGLRIREICNLQVKDINFEDTKIFIRDSKNPKRSQWGYGKDRVVRFDPAISGAIKKWLDIIGDSSKWFVPSDKSPDLSLRPKSVHERFRSYLKQVGLLEVDYTLVVKQKVHGKMIEKKVNRHKYYFHCLRHTMASIIYNKTGDIYAVKEFLGHESIETSQIYAKMTGARMRGVISSVFSSLHYNFENGQHLPNPNPVMMAAKSQPTVATTARSPLELLEIQFINGDISESEFMRKKQVLHATEIKRTIELKG